MDFRKIFLLAFRYPLNVNAFALMLAVDLASSFMGLQFLSIDFTDTASLASNAPLLVAAMIASLAVAIFLLGLFVDNASKYFPSGRRALLKKSLPVAKAKFFRIAGASLVIGVLMLLILAPAIFLGSVAAIAGIAVAIVAYFVFLAPYVVVLSSKGILDSVKESYRIVGRNKLGSLIFLAVYIAVSFAFSFVSAPLVFVTNDLSVYAAIQSVISAYTTLFTYAAFTNFYMSAKKK